MTYIRSGQDDYTGMEGLPDELPGDPMPGVAAWLQAAFDARDKPNPNAMALATADAHGRPSTRIVLCRQVVVDPGYLVFFTNYESRKGREIAANPYASAVFHWDTMERQVRVEGPIVKSPASESDDYFRSRPLDRRLGAWASRQSEPLESRDALVEQAMEVAGRFGVLDDIAAVLDGDGGSEVEVPRPDHWGGYRLHVAAAELWIGGQGRLHDRARWERTVNLDGETISASPWSVTRLQP